MDYSEANPDIKRLMADPDFCAAWKRFMESEDGGAARDDVRWEREPLMAYAFMIGWLSNFEVNGEWDGVLVDTEPSNESMRQYAAEQFELYAKVFERVQPESLAWTRDDFAKDVREWGRDKVSEGFSEDDLI